MNTKDALSKSEIDKIFLKLCAAISEIKSAKEAAELLRDLISYPEAKMIAKRLKIAEMILAGKGYAEIREELKVSFGTIARVQEWLNISGEGYRKAVARTKRAVISNNLPTENFGAWRDIKRRYPMYFWPELLIEGLIKNANEKQKRKINEVLREMNKAKIKTPLFKKISKLMRYR
jgi:TrpR-related protein YerC/YecD